MRPIVFPASCGPLAAHSAIEVLVCDCSHRSRPQEHSLISNQKTASKSLVCAPYVLCQRLANRRGAPGALHRDVVRARHHRDECPQALELAASAPYLGSTMRANPDSRASRHCARGAGTTHPSDAHLHGQRRRCAGRDCRAPVHRRGARRKHLRHGFGVWIEEQCRRNTGGADPKLACERLQNVWIAKVAPAPPMPRLAMLS